MKAIYDFFPANDSDTSVTITTTTANANFPASNLKNIQPAKSWKSTSVAAEQIVKYDFGSSKTYNTFFMNRFNFSEFYLEYSTNDSTWVEVAHKTALTKDEMYDEDYMHIFVDLTGLTYRYLRVRIPAQTPLFETTYFKIGNMLVGDYVSLWNPKPEFQKILLPKRIFTEFNSGYIDTFKLGRGRRVLAGDIDKITDTEAAKFRKTYSPFILYLDWRSDVTEIFLVRHSREFDANFNYATITSWRFSCEELA